MSVYIAVVVRLALVCLAAGVEQQQQHGSVPSRQPLPLGNLLALRRVRRSNQAPDVWHHLEKRGSIEQPRSPNGIQKQMFATSLEDTEEYVGRAEQKREQKRSNSIREPHGEHKRKSKNHRKHRIPKTHHNQASEDTPNPSSGAKDTNRFKGVRFISPVDDSDFLSMPLVQDLRDGGLTEKRKDSIPRPQAKALSQGKKNIVLPANSPFAGQGALGVTNSQVEGLYGEAQKLDKKEANYISSIVHDATVLDDIKHSLNEGDEGSEDPFESSPTGVRFDQDPDDALATDNAVTTSDSPQQPTVADAVEDEADTRETVNPSIIIDSEEKLINMLQREVNEGSPEDRFTEQAPTDSPMADSIEHAASTEANYALDSNEHASKAMQEATAVSHSSNTAAYNAEPPPEASTAVNNTEQSKEAVTKGNTSKLTQSNPSQLTKTKYNGTAEVKSQETDKQHHVKDSGLGRMMSRKNAHSRARLRPKPKSRDAPLRKAAENNLKDNKPLRVDKRPPGTKATHTRHNEKKKVKVAAAQENPAIRFNAQAPRSDKSFKNAVEYRKKKLKVLRQLLKQNEAKRRHLLELKNNLLEEATKWKEDKKIKDKSKYVRKRPMAVEQRGQGRSDTAAQENNQFDFTSQVSYNSKDPMANVHIVHETPMPLLQEAMPTMAAMPTMQQPTKIPGTHMTMPQIHSITMTPMTMMPWQSEGKGQGAPPTNHALLHGGGTEPHIITASPQTTARHLTTRPTPAPTPQPNKAKAVAQQAPAANQKATKPGTQPPHEEGHVTTSQASKAPVALEPSHKVETLSQNETSAQAQVNSTQLQGKNNTNPVDKEPSLPALPLLSMKQDTAKMAESAQEKLVASSNDVMLDESTGLDGQGEMRTGDFKYTSEERSHTTPIPSLREPTTKHFKNDDLPHLPLPDQSQRRAGGPTAASLLVSTGYVPLTSLHFTGINGKAFLNRGHPLDYHAQPMRNAPAQQRGIRIVPLGNFPYGLAPAKSTLLPRLPTVMNGAANEMEAGFMSPKQSTEGRSLPAVIQSGPAPNYNVNLMQQQQQHQPQQQQQQQYQPQQQQQHASPTTVNLESNPGSALVASEDTQPRVQPKTPHGRQVIPHAPIVSRDHMSSPATNPATNPSQADVASLANTSSIRFPVFNRSQGASWSSSSSVIFGVKDELNMDDMYWTDSTEEKEKICRQEKGTDQVSHVMCFGDSLTRGYYNKGKSHHPYTNKLEFLLNKLDSKKCYITENEGKDGDMASGKMAERLEQVLKQAKYGYDWVVILGGTNDIYNKMKTANVNADGLARNIFALHQIAHNHSARTVAVTIPEIFCETQDTCQDVKQVREDVNEKIRQYAYDHHDKVILSELAGKLDRFHTDQELVGQFFEGGLHLKPRGYERMAIIIFEDLKNSLD